MTDEIRILAPGVGSTALAYSEALNPAPWWLSASWLVVLACAFSFLLVSLLQLG
jgi:hypothetical protein